MPPDFHLDTLPPRVGHALRPSSREVRLNGADDELESNAPGVLVFAAEQFVDGDSQGLPLQIQQRHFEGGAGDFQLAARDVPVGPGLPVG